MIYIVTPQLYYKELTMKSIKTAVISSQIKVESYINVRQDQLHWNHNILNQLFIGLL